jgi:hypothetical protein
MHAANFLFSVFAIPLLLPYPLGLFLLSKAQCMWSIVWAAFGIFDFGDSLSRGWLTLALVAGSKTVAAALIIWYAWKWPKQEA